jgi:TetR/AcrR family transcriptional regulator, fatty acid biosynthesis regulator
MNQPVKRTRQRMSPEKRRGSILDFTAVMIARDGIAQLSIESIGKEAGISKSLVYAYFPNLTELLRELYLREMRRLRRRQAEVAKDAASFEELVRSITHVYLYYIHERGPIVQRLQAEPSVSDLHDPTDFSRDVAVDYLTQIVVENFNLPHDIARAATDISFGLSAAAGVYLHRQDIDVQRLEDLTVAMVMGSFDAIKGNYKG